MRYYTRFMCATAVATAVALAAAPAAAQSRLVVPAGTVILVHTNQLLDSKTAATGQTFETTVDQDVGLNDYSVLPAGSKVTGTITMARAATRSQSGVIDVHFTRLILPDGSSATISGKLTSTDSAERRQINNDPNAHVVFVGERGGIGAAIAGAGSSQNPNNILSALGSMLSEGRDVAIPAGTQIAVELDQAVSLRGRGRLAASSSSIYTAADRVRAAQQALAQRNYYRGSVNGNLDNATRRALFAFQVDNRLTGTGNLDGRTAQLLGLSLNSTTGAVLTADNASALRRDANALLARYQANIGINNNGRSTAGRAYAQNEMELLFALSAFADNVSMYEQLLRAGGNADASVRAGRALVIAARRVDAAIAGGGMPVDVQSSWNSLRSRLSEIEAANPGT